MRKVSGVLLAAAMLLPAVFIATPAGAAGGLTCKQLTGTATWTPPVPLKGHPKVKSNTQLAAKFLKCSGTPGVTSGTVKVPVIKGTTKQDCNGLVNAPTKITVPKGGTITWNKGAKSALGPITLTPVKNATATYAAVVKVTAGQFAAKTIKLTSGFKPKSGNCLTTPLKSATLSLKAGTSITVK